MKVRSIPKVYDVINDLKYQNLVVGGCSFTYNVSDTDSSSWPYYLRDKCGFDNVYDCSAAGAGNYHIFTSVVYGLETHNLNPAETLVVIMWSGYGRNNVILPDSGKASGPIYHYNNKVISAIAPKDNHKNQVSLALENYIFLSSLKNYLENQKYQSVFLEFVDSEIPSRETFNIKNFLPVDLQKKYSNMFHDVDNFYHYCLKNDQLQQDAFHPSLQGHHDWTHNVLAPSLTINPAHKK